MNDRATAAFAKKLSGIALANAITLKSTVPVLVYADKQGGITWIHYTTW
jgi:hypothetical protein